ncbi:MAG TPA: hypothetical protein VM784_10215 [Actinomycetota bacterium]|nr:hypothetical protein [Actinomycetota bacterium]
MAFSAFCQTCKRTVYIEEGDTPVCPVCASPLVATIEAPGDEDQIEGAK